MHRRDREAWFAIDAGRQSPRWRDLFGHPDGADYLTGEGKDVAARAATYLEEFFGSSWLARAMDSTGPNGVRIPTLARFSPVLTPFGPAGAYLELIRCWAAQGVLQEASVEGFARLRRDARSDVRLGRLLHTLTQARLAALGLFAGARVTVEPANGDVLLDYGATRVLLELVTISPDAGFEQQTAATNCCFEVLHRLTHEHDVHWTGNIPGQLPSHEFAKWEAGVADAAVASSHRQRPVSLTDAHGGLLTAEPGPAPPGAAITGPLLEFDQGSRLLCKLRDKAAQTQDAGVAWIWVEDHGLLQPLTPFHTMELERKVRAFASLVADVLTEYPHLAGVTISNAARRIYPLPPGHTVESRDAMGFRLGLPIDRQRETIIVPRRLVLPEQTRLLRRLCADEPKWPECALTKLGVRGGVQSLLTS